MARSFDDPTLLAFLDTLERAMEGERLTFLFASWSSWDQFQAWADSAPAEYLARQSCVRGVPAVVTILMVSDATCPASIAPHSRDLPAPAALQMFRAMVEVPNEGASVLVSERFAALMG